MTEDLLLGFSNDAADRLSDVAAYLAGSFGNVVTGVADCLGRPIDDRADHGASLLANSSCALRDGVARVAYCVTAGASAPEHLVQGVINLLKGKFQGRLQEVLVREENVHFSLPKELQKT